MAHDKQSPKSSAARCLASALKASGCGTPCQKSPTQTTGGVCARPKPTQAEAMSQAVTRDRSVVTARTEQLVFCSSNAVAARLTFRQQQRPCLCPPAPLPGSSASPPCHTGATVPPHRCRTAGPAGPRTGAARSRRRLRATRSQPAGVCVCVQRLGCEKQNPFHHKKLCTHGLQDEDVRLTAFPPALSKTTSPPKGQRLIPTSHCRAGQGLSASLPLMAP